MLHKGGNTKLANRLSDGKTTIETRGEGGFIITAPTTWPGKQYQIISGGVATIATITPEERRELFALAATFNEVVVKEDTPKPKPMTHATPGGRPGDDFCSQSTWAEVLTGWTLLYEQHGTGYWIKPGSTSKTHHVTTNYKGSDLLYSFSTSTPFTPERGYNKFAVHTILNYGSESAENFRSATKELAGMGYGEPAAPKTRTKNEVGTVTPPERFTDTELAEYFADLFPDNIRYWSAVKKWLVYDGRRWTSDTPGGGFPFIKAMIKQIRKHVFEIEDHELQIKQLKQVLRLESHPRQETLLSAAAVLRPVIISADKLDGNRMLLNCLNGTLNLTTGNLRTHSPDDYITRMVPIEYDASATCPTFDKFLTRIMGGNQKLTDYLRRFVGYCLTGMTTEQVFLFMWGVGCNGKSTLLTVLENLLGDLASTASSDLLMTQQRGAATNDLAALRGARLVKISEFNENAKLDSARLKTLTGGDRITCRYLYCEPFEYTPEYKIIMAGNSKPRITETDHGTWRRFHIIPFQVIIPEEERDNRLDAKLRAELPGILAWAVLGCLEWQRVGLQPPEEVKAAVADYRKGEDTFHNWLDECCVRGADLWATSKQLLESYQEFTGNRFITATKFGRLLSDSNFIGVSKFSGKAWQGLGLASSDT